MRFVAATLVITFLLFAASPAQADPDQTVRSADQVLHEIMAMRLTLDWASWRD